MGRIAIVFPGQGAQYPGMGKELAEISPAAAEVFRTADAIRPGTSQQCFSGTQEELTETKITQPCMVAVELAAAAALTEAGIRADMTAGFSLGELAALSYAQMVDSSTSFSLACRRGEWMQEAAQQHDTCMAAVVKLSNAEVERLCAQFDGVYPVNYNCPGQVTVACNRVNKDAFSATVKAAGGRALPLKVSGGFHSPYMSDAAEAFGEFLKKVEFSSTKVSVYSNVTGQVYDGDPRELLKKQICRPVRWEEIVRNMLKNGADTFIEAGPGNVLQGLIKKIDANAKVYGVSDRETLNRVIQEVKSC